MSRPDRRSAERAAVLAAALVGGLLIAQQVAGRALRDARAGQHAPGGNECLIIRLDRRGDPEPVIVEIVLDDGRWLRVPTLPGGELVICDLPAGSADVRLPP